MSQQVADHQLARDIGIAQLEGRQVSADRIVPSDFPLIDQHANGRGGHCLRGRPDGKQRVLVDEVGLAQFPDAVPLDEHDSIVLDDGDCEAGNLPVPHRLLNVGLEAGERRRVVCGDRHL